MWNAYIDKDIVIKVKEIATIYEWTSLIDVQMILLRILRRITNFLWKA